MNRKEEYEALRLELERTPPALEYTVQRAQARLRRRRRLTVLGVPAGSLAACLAAFVLLVNLLPPFAYACGRVPVLRALAKAVVWSPGLSAAVDHAYVQPMDLEQTKNNITARVEYAIVDQKQLHIFFTLDSPAYERLKADMPEFAEEQSASVLGAASYPENGDLLEYTVNYVDQDVPDTLTLTFGVYQWEDPEAAPPEEPPRERTLEEQLLEERAWERPDPLAEFTFTLELDPWYTAQGEVVPVDRSVCLDGQTLTVAEAEIYPTHMRLNLADDPANTAWATRFDYYVENEQGERFEGVSNGISGTGAEDSPRADSLYLESAFFSSSQRLTLYITRVYWLDKDRQSFRVDLEQGTADWLPDGARLKKVSREEGGWVLAFRLPAYREGWSYNFVRECRTPDGAPWEPGISWLAGGDGGWFESYVALRDYPDKAVDLWPAFSRVSAYETPVPVPIQMEEEDGL